jgi:hypothetical protein
MEAAGKATTAERGRRQELVDPGGTRMRWPDGRLFAWTVVDDTDRAAVDNVGPVYDFLTDLGLFTTKTVWPLAPIAPPVLGGGTLQDRRYREWALGLRRRGVEIAFHGATDHASRRERVIEALETFKAVFGEDPRLYATHVGQVEGMYWGDARLDGGARLVYRAAQRLRGRDRTYLGHVRGTPFFWGDVCRDRITYVRNLVFRDINTLKHDPMMPYHDPRRPFVAYWFSSSEGATVRDFCRLLGEPNQDRLLSEGGACIVYTHFAFGFYEDGRLDPLFVRLMRRLAALPGWFVPASTLLDGLRARAGWRPQADPRVLRRMQWSWLLSKLRRGTS